MLSPFSAAHDADEHSRFVSSEAATAFFPNALFILGVALRTYLFSGVSDLAGAACRSTAQHPARHKKLLQRDRLMTSQWVAPLYFRLMWNRIIRKLAKLSLISLVVVFVGIQFVPTPGVSKTSTTAPHTMEMINPQVGKILDRSCQDCHSGRTAWPWYSRVAPVSWVISKHVSEGREIVDFSEWATQPPSEDERMMICDAVSDARMPLPEYTVIHRNARLSKQDVKLICDWAAPQGTSKTSSQLQ
jgi:hypothetical protein